MTYIILSIVIIYLIFHFRLITITTSKNMISPNRDIFLASDGVKFAYRMMHYRSQEDFMNSIQGVKVYEKQCD